MSRSQQQSLWMCNVALWCDKLQSLCPCSYLQFLLDVHHPVWPWNLCSYLSYSKFTFSYHGMHDIISFHKAMLSIFMCLCMIRCNMLSMFGLLSPAQWSSNGIAYICATSTSFGVGAVIAMVVAAHGCSSEWYSIWHLAPDHQVHEVSARQELNGFAASLLRVAYSVLCWWVIEDATSPFFESRSRCCQTYTRA